MANRSIIIDIDIIILNLTFRQQQLHHKMMSHQKL